MTRRRAITLSAATFAVMLAASACSRGAEPEVAGETVAVTVQAARLGSIRDVINASGTIVPTVVGDHLVFANQPAEILEITKNEGDAVKAGEVLVRLEVASVTQEINARQLELSEATQRLEAAKTDEAKLEPLVAQGLAARNKLEAARSARMAAESNLTQVKARFDAAKSSDSGSVIRARFTGTVVKRWHVPGEMVSGGESDPILRVIDPTRLQVAIQVPRAQIDRINQGQTATVQTGAATEVAVVSMKGLASDASPTVEVRLNLPATAAPLPLDSIVQAELVLEEFQNVVLIPAGAVQRGDKGAFVWIANEASQAVKREVRVGLSALGSTQVLSGVAAGDQIITTGIAQLTEGATVTISK